MAQWHNGQSKTANDLDSLCRKATACVTDNGVTRRWALGHIPSLVPTTIFQLTSEPHSLQQPTLSSFLNIKRGRPRDSMNINKQEMSLGHLGKPFLSRF